MYKTLFRSLQTSFLQINLQVPTVVNVYLFYIVKRIFQNPNIIEPISNKHTYLLQDMRAQQLLFSIDLTKPLHNYLLNSLKAYDHLLSILLSILQCFYESM